MKQILFIAILLSAFTACSTKGKEKTTDDICFDTIKVDSTIHLTDNPKSPTSEISISLLYSKGKHSKEINNAIIKSGVLMPDYMPSSYSKLPIQTVVDSFIYKAFNEYKTDFKEIYLQDPIGGGNLNNAYKVTTNVTCEKEGYLNYLASIYYYGGGAHGSSLTTSLNFDKMSGKLITLNDLFAPGYKETLNAIIKKCMMKKYKVSKWVDLTNQGIFSFGKVYAPDNFIISDKSITFIYCDDEIAPHCVGEIRLTINNDDLKVILK
nr:DUF3298 domain-containing protein [Prevotella sp.]